MSLTKIGDACAHFPPMEPGGKGTYVKIGTAFRDGDRISFKIDTLPLNMHRWSGWVNVFEDKFAATREKPKGVGQFDSPDEPAF